MYFFVILRIFIGSIFIISGLEKLIGPYQNFLYVIDNYEILPPFLEEFTARVFPWLEFFLGIFLILGLWTKLSLWGVISLFLIFLTVVGQALVRKLPITECGCFGGLISVPLYVVFLFDTVSLMLSGLLLLKFSHTSKLSLDHYFLESE